MARSKHQCTTPSCYLQSIPVVVEAGTRCLGCGEPLKRPLASIFGFGGLFEENSR